MYEWNNLDCSSDHVMKQVRLKKSVKASCKSLLNVINQTGGLRQETRNVPDRGTSFNGAY